ncbi:MAG: PAS domain-containing protein [Vulcanimicrobiota bacterium]
MKKRPVQIQSEFFENVWEKRNIDAVFDYFDGKAGGLGVEEPLDPVGYIDFYHALTSVVKDVEFEILDWAEHGERLFLDFVMKARARRKDKAVFWYCSAWGHYNDGKIAGGENYLDFFDLFRQLELVPQEAVELGLAGEEILQLGKAGDALGKEFRRLFWPNFEPLGGEQRLLLPTTAVRTELPSAEQLEVLFHSATFGMVTTDQDDRVIELNERFAKLLLSEGEQLLGQDFSSLIVGQGKEAEAWARASVLSGEKPSYRILLHLRGAQSTVRVWVSAVLFARKGKAPLLLRSVQRDRLIDDLVSMQEEERKFLLTEIREDVLKPILDLWKLLTPGDHFGSEVREHCLEITSRLAKELREKVKSLRNPVLQGIPLSRAWPERTLDSSLDRGNETSALLVYCIVNECTSHLGSSISDLKLTSESGFLRGSLSISCSSSAERLALLKELCHLVGGRFQLVEDADKRSWVSFEIPEIVD